MQLRVILFMNARKKNTIIGAGYYDSFFKELIIFPVFIV